VPTVTATSSTSTPSPSAAATIARPPGSTSAPAASGSSSPTALLYGAVHERSAIDISFAFARTFPQATARYDVWRKQPFGSAGEADVTITIDELGRVVGFPIIKGTPSDALKVGISQTFNLIRGRQFIARGARTTLHVTATVVAKDIHAFALGDGLFIGDVSSSWFELPPDRHIDVRIKLNP
jgi:hypothetical protein